MTSPAVRWWTQRIVSGAILGAVILGVGGRVAMRVIAIRTRPFTDFNIDGSFTVLMSGVAAGIAGSLMYAAIERFGPQARWIRIALYAVILGFLTSRGLHPATTLSVVLFGPLVMAFGACVLAHARAHPLPASRPSLPDIATG